MLLCQTAISHSQMSSCNTFPKNLTVTLPRPSYGQIECSGPHALLAVQTEPHVHMHLSKQMMRCVYKHVKGTGVQNVCPSQFSTYESQR